MKTRLTRVLLFVAGLMLIVWSIMPTGAVSVGATPLRLVTEVPTAEPPLPPTNTPPPPTTAPLQPTAAPPPSATREIGQLTPGPTDTPVATSVAPPAEPPPSGEPTSVAPPAEPPPSGEPKSTATPTASPVPPSPTAIPTAVASAPVDLAISKSVSPSKANVGAAVVYTLSVTNLGGSTATDAVVEDTLPAIVAPVSAATTKGTASVSGQTVRVTIGTVAPGETVTITVQAKVVKQPTASNNLNLATVASSSPDGNLANNKASVPLAAALVPAVLPATGDDGPGQGPLFAGLLGLALIAASVLVRRRAA